MDVDLPAHVKFWSNEANNDCFFVVGPESGPTERIGALKVFLVGHSEPFRVMFGTGSKLAEKGDVRIVDVDPETFKMFLRCLYGGTDLILPKITFEATTKLLYVAEKYLVDDLKAKIVNRFSRALSPTTVLHFLKYPICLKIETLEKAILLILQSDFEQIMNEKVLEVDRESLLWMLKKSDFKVKELKIWEIVLKWAMHKANSSDGKVLRSQMYPLLRHIRFLTMNLMEFCQNVVPKDVLTKEEVYATCKWFGTGTPPNFEHLCNLRNSRNSRTSKSASTTSKLTINSLNHSGNMVVLASANITDLKEKEFSQAFHFKGCSWNIGAWKRPDEYSVHHLILYLKCDFNNSDYRCYVTGEFSVLHDCDESFIMHFGHTLKKVNNVCSVRIKWDDLKEGGYVKYGKVEVLVHFTGIME